MLSEILAPDELALTTFGDVRVMDSENGGLQEVTFGRYRMKAFQQAVQNFNPRLREFTTKRGINFFMAPSNMDLQDLLLKHLMKSAVGDSEVRSSECGVRNISRRTRR